MRPLSMVKALNEAIYQCMLEDKNIHCFFHQDDDVTLTSKGYIWTYPNNMTSKKSVIVSLGPERPSEECFGICSDYVQKLK